MKDFLKFTLATVTGIILSSIVLFIISMVTLFGIMSASDTETIVKKNSVMMLDLNGTLVERTQEDRWAFYPSYSVTGLIHMDWTTFFRLSKRPKRMKTSKGFICRQVHWAHPTLLYRRFVTHCLTLRKAGNSSLLMVTLIPKGFIIFPV